jgi:hypothetical protein
MRTVRRQAELMADQARADTDVLADTYTPRGQKTAPAYVNEMVQWVQQNPGAGRTQAVDAFEDIITRARANGYTVSRHLGDAARDISTPQGTPEERRQIEARLRELGVRVLPEPDAAGGPHWHINLDNNARRAPQTPNTGTYSEQARQDRQVVPGNVPRSQRIERIQRISPMKSGFGGVILGSRPEQAPRPIRADLRLQDGHVFLDVEVEGTPGRHSYGGITPTELWCAYHFVRPGQDAKRLGAEAGDLGLVGIARNKMGTHGSWEFGVHPALANTWIGWEAMRLDMVLALGDPRLPALPGGWVTYRWYDAPARITAGGGRISIRPAAGPEDIVMRLQLWGKDKMMPFNSEPLIEQLGSQCEPLRHIDRFARTVALLSWLDEAGKLPSLPAGVGPQRYDLAPECHFSEVVSQSATASFGKLTAQDPVDTVLRGAHRKIHVVELTGGQEYVVDLESGQFDPLLRVEDRDGKQVAFDDDSAGGLDARVVLRPGQTAIYRLIVTTYKPGATGSYFLKVWPGEVGPGQFLMQAAGALNANDPRDAVRRNSPHRVHLCRLRAGRTYEIGLASKFDNYLRLEDSSRRQLAQDDDSGGNLTARMVVTPQATEQHRIIVTSFNASSGGYVLSVRRTK